MATKLTSNQEDTWINGDVSSALAENRMLSEQKQVLESADSGQPLGQCLSSLTEAVSRLQPGVRACVLMANAERTAIADSFTVHLSRSFGEALRGAPINDLPIATCVTAIYTGQPASCKDIANTGDWSREWRDLCLSEDVHAAQSTPIFGTDGKAIASFLMCLAEPREFNEWERRIAALAAHAASIVIERDRVNRDLHVSRAQMEEQLADARLLQKLSMELVHEESAALLYQKIMDAAVAIMRSQYGSMQVLYPDSGSIGKLRLLASSGFTPEAEKYWEWVYAATDSSCGAALRAGKRVIISNMPHCEFMQGTETLPLYLEGGIYAAQSTPLYSRNGKLLGMISTHWKRPHTPSERDLNLLDILARQAADLVERNQTSEALKQSEERLRAFTTATSDVLYRMSPDWSEMYQLDGRNFLADTGQPMFDWMQKYIHPNDQPRVKEAIGEAVRAKTVFQLEHQVMKADGTIGWTFSRAIPILDGDGNIVEWFGAASDVTERRRAEAEAHKARDESERRKRLYEAVTGSTPDLIYVFDLNYRFTYANEALLNMWGTTWDKAIGKGLLELGYEPWHARMHEREIDQIVATRKPIRGQVSFPHAELGRRIYDYIFVPVLNTKGEVEAVAGTTRDITELKRTEDALKESEAKFRRFYESNMLPIAFWTVDGQIYECNDAFALLTGYSQAEIITGKYNWLENTAPEFKLINEEGIKWAIEGNVFISPYEIELMHKKGNKVNVVVGYAMLEGSKQKGVAFLMDVTEQKSLMTQLEKRVKERTEELKRSNDDLQQFAHVASHDLKEPVRKIKTFAYRLNDELNNGLTEKSKVYVEKVLASADRMATMIEGVLTYSAFGASDEEAGQLDLNEILSDIENDLEVLMQQKGGVIKRDILPGIEGVEVLIYQLFYNLINNSLKFSKKGQSPVVTITSNTVSLKGQDYVKIVVADNGIGFDPSYSKKIFDTFARLNSKDKYDGTGLGLSLCKKIAERHHGSIEATGEDGEGAVFTVTLPLKRIHKSAVSLSSKALQ